jgi:hypothetical protein
MFAHRVDHTIGWDVDGTGSSLAYTVDVPHAMVESDLADALRSGLNLSVDGVTQPLTVVDTRLQPRSDGVRVRLALRADHGPGRIRLSNGNLLDASGRHLHRIRIAPDLDLVDDTGAAPATSPLARTRTLELTPAPWWRRLHRRAHDPLPWRPPEPQPADLTRNDSTPLFALVVGLLGVLLPLPAPRERLPAVLGTVLAVLALALPVPPALGLALAAGCLVAAWRRPGWMAPAVVALLATVPLQGLALLALPANWIAVPTRRRTRSAALFAVALLAVLQAARIARG